MSASIYMVQLLEVVTSKIMEEVNACLFSSFEK